MSSLPSRAPYREQTLLRRLRKKAPPEGALGRYRPDDRLIAFLKEL